MHDLSIFFSYQSVIIFLLVLTRLLGMIGTAPLFSTFPVPHQVKLALAALSSFIMYPFITLGTEYVVPHDMISLSILIFKEMAVGLLIGFAASLIFTAVEIGGQILSIQMGLAIANALDPVTKQHTPIVGQFYLFMSSIVFISLNGAQWLFSTVYDSYKSIPIGMGFSFSSSITEQLLYFSGQLFVIAFSIIIPVFSILFIKTILIGIISKIMPQMNIFMISIPSQICVGLVLMLLLMPSTTIYLSKLFNELLTNINNIFIL